jgi:hypothetical protein
MTAMTRPNSRPFAPSAAARARGFAFTEILFAVMVLGLGFIMIAAMFPVTIRQTQSTMEEATAAGVAQAAMEYLQSIASEDLFPITVPPAGSPPPTNPDIDRADLSEPAEVLSFNDVFYANPRKLPSANRPAAWNGKPAYFSARGNFVDPKNPRIAWVPMYRRANNSPFAQVFIVVVQARNRDLYVTEMDRTGKFPDRNYSDLEPPPDAPAGKLFSTLQPRRVVVGVEWGEAKYGMKQGVITIDPEFRELAATGAYLIIAHDPNKGAKAKPLEEKGQSNGRIYQLGNPVDEANGVWEISPATDMVRKSTTDQKIASEPGDDNELPFVFPYDKDKSTTAYLIGRGYHNPASAAEGYAGPAQEIGVYTGFIHVPPAPAQ